MTAPRRSNRNATPIIIKQSVKPKTFTHKTARASYAKWPPCCAPPSHSKRRKLSSARKPSVTCVKRSNTKPSNYWQLLELPRSEPNEESVRNRLHKQRDHFFNFLDRNGVEATNNLTERQLCPAVIARKISCGNKLQRRPLPGKPSLHCQLLARSAPQASSPPSSGQLRSKDAKHILPLSEYYTDLPGTLHTSLFHFPDAETRCAYLGIVPEKLRVGLRNQPPRFKHVTPIARSRVPYGHSVPPVARLHPAHGFQR
jgi:hypothetical protein